MKADEPAAVGAAVLPEGQEARLPRQLPLRLKLLFGSLLSLVLLVLLVLTVEVALRLVYPAPLVERLFAPAEETVGYGLASSETVAYSRGGRTIRVTTDASGRRVVPDAPSGSGARTLHVLGDSQVFGWDLADAETLPAFLQQRLGPGWRVVNHGVPGYGPFAYAERLAALPPGDAAVVIQTEANDLADSFAARAPAFARCGFLVPRNFIGTSFPCSWLASYTFAKVTEIAVLSGDSRLPVPIGFNPWTRSAAAVLKYRVDKIYRAAAEGRRAPMLLATIPWDAALIPERTAHYRPLLDHPPRTVELADGLGLAAAFESHPRPQDLFLPNDYHLSAAGAAFAAERLAPAVLRAVSTSGEPWPTPSSAN